MLKVHSYHASIANLLECTDVSAVAKELLCWFDAELSADESYEEYCEELKFVVTGKLKYFENREELVEFIEDQGGYVTGSISSKTNYLICNDKNSTSSKVKKAKDLGIRIISEAEFIRRFAPDEFDLEESDETEGAASEALDKKNETLETMKHNFTQNLTGKVQTISDMKEVSLTVEFGGRGEFLKGADDVIGTIFGYSNFLKIEEIISKCEKEELIKNELSGLDFMKHFTEESIDGVIKFVREHGRESVECTVTQKLLENGMVSMEIFGA